MLDKFIVQGVPGCWPPGTEPAMFHCLAFAALWFNKVHVARFFPVSTNCGPRCCLVRSWLTTDESGISVNINITAVWKSRKATSGMLSRILSSWFACWEKSAFRNLFLLGLSTTAVYNRAIVVMRLRPWCCPRASHFDHTPFSRRLRLSSTRKYEVIRDAGAHDHIATSPEEDLATPWRWRLDTLRRSGQKRF